LDIEAAGFNDVTPFNQKIVSKGEQNYLVARPIDAY
jgi:hypothetical protein